jgi:glucoamylase
MASGRTEAHLRVGAKGRSWPLLTGERGHYELATGHDPTPFIRAMQGFAFPTGLLPEQVWGEPDWPGLHMFQGRPTGAANAADVGAG